jgi:hypothetical protein
MQVWLRPDLRLKWQPVGRTHVLGCEWTPSKSAEAGPGPHLNQHNRAPSRPAPTSILRWRLGDGFMSGIRGYLSIEQEILL